MSDPKAFMNFAAFAAIAAITVTQMLRARDNPSGQALDDAFDPDDKPLLLAICKDYEGKAPTARQKNPHPPGTLAFATWVIACSCPRKIGHFYWLIFSAINSRGERYPKALCG
ncbi:hypothetical protein ACI0FM_15885 [Paenochrobactrum sp. BZR 588]